MKMDIRQFNPCKAGLEYYLQYSDPKEAWNNCQRGDWMAWITYHIPVSPETVAICKQMVGELVITNLSTDAVSEWKAANISGNKSLMALTNVAALMTNSTVVCGINGLAALCSATTHALIVSNGIEQNKANIIVANVVREVLTTEIFKLL